MTKSLMNDAAQEKAEASRESHAGTHPRTIRSEDLFAGARMVAIADAGETYRLLFTRNNRLALQK